MFNSVTLYRYLIVAALALGVSACSPKNNFADILWDQQNNTVTLVISTDKDGQELPYVGVGDHFSVFLENKIIWQIKVDRSLTACRELPVSARKSFISTITLGKTPICFQETVEWSGTIEQDATYRLRDLQSKLDGRELWFRVSSCEDNPSKACIQSNGNIYDLTGNAAPPKHPQPTTSPQKHKPNSITIPGNNSPR